MKRLSLAALALGATLAVGAHAQTVTIRWGDVVPATHPSVQMIERIAADEDVQAAVRREHPLGVGPLPAAVLDASDDARKRVLQATDQPATSSKLCPASFTTA